MYQYKTLDNMLRVKKAHPLSYCRALEELEGHSTGVSVDAQRDARNKYK